jgi:hypothetical protein
MGSPPAAGRGSQATHSVKRPTSPPDLSSLRQKDTKFLLQHPASTRPHLLHLLPDPLQLDAQTGQHLRPHAVLLAQKAEQ